MTNVIFVLSEKVINGRQTECLLTMHGIISLQSTKSGRLKYHSLVNADSWAPQNPPPNNWIPLLLFLHSSSCALTHCDPLPSVELWTLCSFPQDLPPYAAPCFLPSASRFSAMELIFHRRSSAIFLADELEVERKFPTSHRTINIKVFPLEVLQSGTPYVHCQTCALVPFLSFPVSLSLLIYPSIPPISSAAPSVQL